MLATWHQVESPFEKVRVVHHGCPRSVICPDRVTVLLFFLATCGTLHAEESKGSGLRVFEFRCEFRIPPFPGRMDGLMTSDGHRQRIAIYWIEPAMFREAPSFLRCCDLMIDREVVHYWIQGISQPRRFDLSDGQKGPLLPPQRSAESVLRSALALVGHVRCSRDETDTPLEVATFFERSRGRAEFKYDVSRNDLDGSQSLDSRDSGAKILNALPYGREYLKETREDGSMVWRARKAANGAPVATVTIRRIRELEQGAGREAFDEHTLGQWTLIGQAYRAYWSFDRALGTMRLSSDARTPARDVYDKLNSYLDQNSVPPEVSRGLDRLRFQVALMTADSNCVWQSAQAVVTGLCKDNGVPAYQCLLDLGSMSALIRRQHPQRMEEKLHPLVGQMVKHAGRDMLPNLNALMRSITSNGWFTYGGLLLEQVRRAGLMDERSVALLAAKLKASRLARAGAASDPCDATPTVQQYLLRLDDAPPIGAMDINDVRHVINEGLARRYTPDMSEAKRKVMEDTIRAIRLIAGEGPFRGDPDRLIASIDRFSRHCLVVNRSTDPFDTVLATFLALSFCDISTPEDHELLFSQLQHCSAELQGQVNTMLAGRGLTPFVTPEDVGRTFQVYEGIFRRYMDDPLGPAFKFPWTRNEETRLGARLRLRLMQLEPLLDEMALKVKYGGASAELKDRTISEISEAAQELLPQAAFLRIPPYPGVSCQYHAGYGFSVVIEGPLYREGDRPRERFQAMKYFHLGHRLQGVVERELTRHAEKEETSK
jgi:hypothetical protein